MELRPRINDLEVADGHENATKKLNVTVPVQDSLGSDDHQCGPPFFPDFLQTHPEQSVPFPDLGMTDASLEDLQLLPQSEILQSDLFVAAKDQKRRAKKGQDGV